MHKKHSFDSNKQKCDTDITFILQNKMCKFHKDNFNIFRVVIFFINLFGKLEKKSVTDIKI